MGMALWVVQVLLAAVFLVSGATKLSQPKEKLVKTMAWVEFLAADGAYHRRPGGLGGDRDRAAGADGDPALADDGDQQSSLSLNSELTVVALLVAVVGIVIQIFSGVGSPTVPPGLIILLVAAGLVAFGPWRWTPLVGATVGWCLLVGFVLSGQVSFLLDLGQFDRLVGVWVLFLAVIVAIIQNYRPWSMRESSVVVTAQRVHRPARVRE